MRKFIYLFLLLITISLEGQVGINNQTPEAFKVVGKPNDVNYYGGIIPQRIKGNQITAKTYTLAKGGAVVYLTSRPTTLSGQAVYILEPGLYYFNEISPRDFSKEKQPVEYVITVVPDHNSTADILSTSNLLIPANAWLNKNAYLTASKQYTFGTKNYGGLNGFILFKKINGIINVSFQIYSSNDLDAINGNAFINVPDIYSDIGYIPNQIVLLHTENSTQFFPVLLENYAIQIPQTSVIALLASYYTYGEVQGYYNWIKPYLQ